MSVRRANQLFALGMLLALVLVTYFAFRPGLPFSDGYRVRAVVASANQLRGGSPVRIAGVDVGEVVAIEPGPGETSTIVLEIEEAGRPLHRDATLRIRPRVFLEGGFYVDLRPGTPAAPELADGGTLPLPQTARPVQFHQLLSVFEQPVVDSLRGGVGAFSHGLRGGGAEGLRAAVPNLAPALRDVAIAAEAAQGTRPGDVTRLIEGAGRLTGALAADRRALADMVTNLRRSADALAADDTALADSLVELEALIRMAPSGLRALDGALPVAERVGRGLAGAVRIAPRALRRAGAAVDEIGGLVAPAVRDRTIRGLRTTFLDLPTLVVRMASLFPAIEGVSDCLRTHIVPVLRSPVDDGALSSGRPVYEDFAHAMVGLASATQNFDGNGYNTRYLFGLGGETFSTDAIPGTGTLFGESSGPLQSRPVRPADGEPPPIRRDVACSTQPFPDLTAEVGPG